MRNMMVILNSRSLIILAVIWVKVYPYHLLMFPFLSMTIPIYYILQGKTEYKN